MVNQLINKIINQTEAIFQRKTNFSESLFSFYIPEGLWTGRGFGHYITSYIEPNQLEQRLGERNRVHR